MKLKLTPKLALIFFWFAVGMLIGVGIQADTQSRTALEAAAETELQATAGEKQATLERWIFDREASIAALAASPYMLQELETFLEAGPGAASASDRLTRELLVNTGAEQSFLALFILSPEDGQVIISTDENEKGNSKADRDYFIKGTASIFTTPFFFSSALTVPAMTSAAPLRSEDGTLLGVLAGR